MTIYDSIGRGYSKTRKSDYRIVEALLNILKLSEISTIADLGAGTGSYALALAKNNYNIIAIEPSKTMRSQANTHPNIKWIDASAESLPLSNGSVDAVIIMLAMHHFQDYRQALKEAYRVTNNGSIIIFTYDPIAIDRFWLTNYFPSLITDVKATFVPIDRLVFELKKITEKTIKVAPFSLPNDLVDSFAAVGWGRPELYLDKSIRQGISSFSKLKSTEINSGLLNLKEDLKSGKWDNKYKHLRTKDNYDVGYRSVYC